MNLRTQWIVAIVIIVALCIIINMIRKKSLELRYALAWLLVGVGIIVLDLFPGLLEKLSKIMGITNPINMLFFFGFCFSLGIIFVLTLAVSKMSIRIKELAQKVALHEMEDKKE